MNQGSDIDLSEPNAAGLIAQPREIDVLSGRGGAIQRHAGNENYRHLVSENKPTYATCEKSEKLKISKSIVAAVRQLGGRFLAKDKTSNLWHDIGDQKAVEKTSQALREGQQKILKKMAHQGMIEETADQVWVEEAAGFEPPSPPFVKEALQYRKPPPACRTRQPEMEPVRPPSPSFSTTSDMLRRMSLESSKASSASAISTGIPNKPLIADRALTIDMGVPLSQMSLMSEFSDMGSIKSKIGSVSLRRPSDTSSIPTRRTSGYSKHSDISHSQAGLLMNGMSMLSMQSMSLATIDSSPLESESTGRSRASNVDLRDVFASMKYKRRPSREPQHSTDDFHGFYPVESRSAYSDISAMTGMNDVESKCEAISPHRHLSNLQEETAEDYSATDLNFDQSEVTNYKAV